jgi:murein DD-endopeptidase MepM/ murein hydrolase activator NlpD
VFRGSEVRRRVAATIVICLALCVGAITTVSAQDVSESAHQHHQFIWPVDGTVTVGFGCTSYVFVGYYDPACPYPHRFNDGLIIAAACRTPVQASDSGTIALETYQQFGYGDYLIIRDKRHGWETLYAHLSGFAVTKAQRVRQGAVIGWVGATGDSTGCALRFDVFHNGNAVDPAALLP